jgi:hypothetical protein
MSENRQAIRIVTLAMLTLVLLLSALSASIGVLAQADVLVEVLPSIGGTTDPPAGTNTFTSDTDVEFEAFPDENSYFNYWVITNIEGGPSTRNFDNPATIHVTDDFAIQPVFEPIQVAPNGTIPTDTSTAAIVVVLPASGGTTDPAPGTYIMANAEQLMLTALPYDGWDFSHWVISGDPQFHGPWPYNPRPTDNPYTVDHGYGNTYGYQPVFVPHGSTDGTGDGGDGGGGETGADYSMWIIIGLAVVVVVLIIAFVVYAVKK